MSAGDEVAAAMRLVKEAKEAEVQRCIDEVQAVLEKHKVKMIPGVYLADGQAPKGTIEFLPIG